VPGLGRLPGLVPSDLATTFSLEPELRSAIATSRRVGALLLKAEEQEMAAVAAAAEELISKEYRCGALMPDKGGGLVGSVCVRWQPPIGRGVAREDKDVQGDVGGQGCARRWRGAADGLRSSVLRLRPIPRPLACTSAPARSVPCVAERDACIDCYRSNKQVRTL
jgi:hypothetical protein